MSNTELVVGIMKNTIDNAHMLPNADDPTSPSFHTVPRGHTEQIFIPS